MSYRAIAAALALEDVSVGERLVAYSLASYAGRDHLAWPAARTAAVRAGLSRGQYFVARAALEQRGALVVEEVAAGRPSGAAVMRLRFAEDGPSIEREINAGLFEAVLARSSVTGGARALLATLAALADDDGSVEGLGSEEISEASGLSDRTYRRARSELLEHGEITLDVAGGGRSRRNRWRVRDPRTAAGTRIQAAVPVRSSAGSQMPLMAAVRDTSPTGRSSSAEMEPRCVGSSVVEPGALSPGRNPGVNPGQIRTPSCPETPAQTPAETPAPHARAGRKSLNLRTRPPDPPEGGHSDAVSVIEEYVSDRGRRRRRLVAADPAEISCPTERDQADWRAVREALRDALGEPMFDVWFVEYALRAVSARDRALLIDGPAQTGAWVGSRYGPLLGSLAERVGRRLRVASDRELTLLRCLDDPTAAAKDSAHTSRPSVSRDHKEVV